MELALNLMTADPVCFTPDAPLNEIAKAMIEHDCGEVPIVDSLNTRRIAGVITDRDICCRSVGKGLNPLTMNASEVMTFPAVTVLATDSVDKCCEVMEKNKIRRAVVVDDYEKVVGIISLADIMLKKEALAVEVMREISRPKESSLQ